MDCFEKIDEIQEWIQRRGLCFVLCDGGNKPKEFNTFSKFLKSGDVISAHDYCDETVEGYSPLYWGWREVPLESIRGAIKSENLEDFEPAWFQFSAWKCVYKA